MQTYAVCILVKYLLAMKLYGPNAGGALYIWLTKAELILITSERLKLVPLTGKNFNVNIRGAPGLNRTSESATDPGGRLMFCASVDSNCWNIVGFVTSEKAGARKIINPWKGLVQVQLCEGAGFANWSVGHEIAPHEPRLVEYGT
jgi:hypothetical protein